MKNRSWIIPLLVVFVAVFVFGTGVASILSVGFAVALSEGRGMKMWGSNS